MNEKYKKRIPKVLPVGIAMGILFSASPLASPLTENKVKADVDTVATIITTFGSIYDTFLKEPFGKWLEEIDVKNYYYAAHENIAYKAPTFQKGEFGISVFDYYKNKDFSKKVKIVYSNGKSEYKTIKHGEQLRIKDAGTMVDLTPDEADPSNHHILYITQKQLDEGNTGISLTTFKIYYLQSDNSGRKNNLADKFLRKEFPNAYLKSGLLDIRVNEDELFKKLPKEKQILATITSKPVGGEVLPNTYFFNDPEAVADFNNRLVNVVADTKLTLEMGIAVGTHELNDKPFQIIPIKKGSNKVIVKQGRDHVSGKEGPGLHWTDGLNPEEILELVPIENSGNNELQFNLINKNGARLIITEDRAEFTTDKGLPSNLRFTGKTNNELHNWLREWYPGKENEEKKYGEIQIVIDEKDSRIWTAKDSDGNVIKNSWIRYGGEKQYVGPDGIVVRDRWYNVEGKTYYFGSSGPFRGSYENPDIDGKQYHFDNEGVLQKSVWKNKKYSDHTGAFVKEGLREIDGKIYYFKDFKATTNELRLEDQNIILHFSDKGALEKATRLNGESLNSITYVTFDEKTLTFEKDGSIRKFGVSKVFDDKGDPSIVYYSLEEGPFYTGWKEIDEKKYYFESGEIFKFDYYENIDGIRYYINHEGQARLRGFYDINGGTIYINDKGEKVSGFQNINGKLYYFGRDRMYKDELFSLDVGVYAAGPDGVIYQNFKGYMNNNIFGQTYIETNNEGLVTNR
ncbi:cell wall-binding protein [Bacillus multifaciens]|uniref:cell wall-binding protein n=1 Tax=Bacillus multifaciens TaxID=3068506 RepID=UPI0027424D8D|nr:cell wall-binding protein [Bacillus sp. WLY-B-L8]MDP7978024.1 cell wall-binding protein [Bacillus sp. WLY-B-L8]